MASLWKSTFMFSKSIKHCLKASPVHLPREKVTFYTLVKSITNSTLLWQISFRKNQKQENDLGGTEKPSILLQEQSRREKIHVGPI